MKDSDHSGGDSARLRAWSQRGLTLRMSAFPRVLTLVLLTLVLLAGCGTRRNPAVCCETTDECAQIGTAEIVSCEVGVCVAHSCVDLGACDGIEDCTESGQSCIDGRCTFTLPPDAARVAAYDVAYPNVWRRSITDAHPLSLLFVNRGVSPLSMSTLQVRSLADDHPTAFVRVTVPATPSTAMILPGQAGGLVTPLAEDLLIGMGIVPEQRVDQETSYADVQILDAPSGTYDIGVDVVFALDGLDVATHLTIHMEPLPVQWLNPLEGTRATIFR